MIFSVEHVLRNNVSKWSVLKNKAFYFETNTQIHSSQVIDLGTR